MKFLSSITFLLSTLILKSYSLKLHCKFDECENANGESIGYCCEINSPFQITSRSDRNITEIVGEHKPGKSNKDLVQIFSDRNKMLWFPRGLETFFKKLSVIDFKNSKMLELSPNDVWMHKNLDTLTISGANLKFIESNTFERNKKINQLFLPKNQIENVEKGAITKLKLDWLHMSDNPCFDLDSSTGKASEAKKLSEQVEKFCSRRNWPIIYASVMDELEMMHQDVKKYLEVLKKLEREG